MNKKLLLSGCGFVLIITICILVIRNTDEKPALSQQQGIISTLESYSGTSQVIEEKEYDFYFEIVRKEFENQNDKDKIQTAANSFIQDTYAQFLIGNKLNICKPYSFQTLERDMKIENQQRKIKKNKNEIFYGPLEFKLESYFKYILNNLKSDIIEVLYEKEDPDLIENAKNYYQKNPDTFTRLESVEYEITVDSTTEKKVLKREDMSILEKTNSNLFQSLYTRQEGEEFLYLENGQEVSGKILSKKKSVIKYQEAKEEIIKVYISEVVYPELVRIVGDHNPLEFGK